MSKVEINNLEAGQQTGKTTGPGNDRAGEKKRTFMLILGPAVALFILLLPVPEGMPILAWRTAAVMVWMAIWWATEVLPVAVTAFLPLVLFTPLGIATFKASAAPYANPNIYLFLGGFIMAAAIERWNLHLRIALGVLRLVGSDSRAMIGGFMLASAVLSMWMSNTSTTMMLLPIGLSIVTVVTTTVIGLSAYQKQNFQAAMMLGIAYAATIGGVATLVGTPPNALLASFMEQEYDMQIGFARWMLIGLPVSLTLLPIAWWVLTRRAFPVDFNAGPETTKKLVQLREDLGPMSIAERRVAIIFAVLALSWMLRPFLNGIAGLEGLNDAGLAMTIAVILFLVPSGQGDGQALMNWDRAAQLPWGILILFGGGLSLAAAVSGTGLAQWLGASLAPLGGYGIWVLVIATVLLVVFLTELTSNLATTAAFLPVVAAVAVELGYSPVLLAVPVALAASCAFMLPVATPPNAIVFSSGLLTIRQMAKAGVAMNLLALILISLVALLLVPIIL
ncbi:MAG: sodium-dependent dicarboxylate transporter 2/3/5 [Gammaproteobacteria bacterium]|jgi:sodium-dependent dicarboxylate transporter 2/3/5